MGLLGWGACSVCSAQVPTQPRPSQSCWWSPGRLSQVGIRGREPQAGTGKRFQLQLRFFTAKFSPSAVIPASPGCIPQECMTPQGFTFHSLGAWAVLAAEVSVWAAVSLHCLEFRCEGAILALPVCSLYTLKLGLHLEGDSLRLLPLKYPGGRSSVGEKGSLGRPSSGLGELSPPAWLPAPLLRV